MPVTSLHALDTVPVPPDLATGVPDVAPAPRRPLPQTAPGAGLPLPTFDETKDTLSDLYTNGHDVTGHGQSFRRLSDNECRQYLRDRSHDAKQHKRQAKAQAEV